MNHGMDKYSLRNFDPNAMDNVVYDDSIRTGHVRIEYCATGHMDTKVASLKHILLNYYNYRPKMNTRFIVDTEQYEVGEEWYRYCEISFYV